MASTMLINALITDKIKQKKKEENKRKISKKNSILFSLIWNKILAVRRTRRKARENWKRIVRYRLDDPYSFRSNFTHRRSRKSWHWLWDRLQTESHAFRVVALIFAGRCQNLFGLHRGQVRRSGPRLKRNSHVIVAYRKSSKIPWFPKFEIINATDEARIYFRGSMMKKFISFNLCEILYHWSYRV